jgi:hypothetical protein
MFETLDDDNVLLYAAKNYQNLNCVMSEFEEDYKRVRYIKRLLQRYRQTGEIKELLTLNHIVIMKNVFGLEASVRILFLRIDPKDWSSLKTFLVFLYSMPNIVRGIDGVDIISSDIPLDQKIVELLRKV